MHRDEIIFYCIGIMVALLIIALHQCEQVSNATGLEWVG